MCNAEDNQTVHIHPSKLQPITSAGMYPSTFTLSKYVSELLEPGHFHFMLLYTQLHIFTHFTAQNVFDIVNIKHKSTNTC